MAGFILAELWTRLLQHYVWLIVAAVFFLAILGLCWAGFAVRI